MSVEITFSETPTKKDNFVSKRQITKEDFSIFQIYSPTNKKHYFLKLFSKTKQGKDRYEREKLAQHLDHPNIIQYFATVLDGEYRIVTEFPKYGTFADILKQGPLMTETLVRTYFHQLIEGIDYIHSQGFAHLDLNLENLVLGEDFSLKITSFDKSQLTLDPTLITETGQGSPKALLQNQNNLAANDIFSAGLILFAFRTGKLLPFPSYKSGKEKDTQIKTSYAYFLSHNEEFWKSKTESALGFIRFSKELIELVNSMLSQNEDERPTILEIKNSEWYKRPILKLKQLGISMRPRIQGSRGKKRINCLMNLYTYIIAKFC